MARSDSTATGPDGEDRAKSRRLGSLGALWPFMKPYRKLMLASVVALVLTATLSLLLPLAVRRVVDNFNV